MPSVAVKPRHPRLNPGHPLARGLAGCWPLWEQAGTIAHDVVANQPNLAFSAGEVWLTDRRGNVASGPSQNTTSQYLSATLDGTALGDMTVLCWVQRRANVGSATVIGLFSWARAANPADGTAFALINDNDTNLQYYVDAGYRNTSQSTLALNTWHQVGMACHIAAGASAWTFYLDGQNIGTYSGAVAQQANANVVYFGSGYNGSMDGLLDLPMLWINRRLSDAEVNQLYRDPYGLLAAPDAMPSVRELAAAIAAGRAGQRALVGVGA